MKRQLTASQMGKLGGASRARKLSPERRREIASKAGKAGAAARKAKRLSPQQHQKKKEQKNMGEYANYNGSRIKIGTCEEMYYLRADQRELVQHLPNNVDPVRNAKECIRFRFPFPEEDHIRPGGFDDPFKAFGVYSADELLSDCEHTICQFTAPGFCASLPCPESDAAKDLPFKIHRNGYPGSVQIVQQRLIGEEWWTVCQCGGCGAKFRLPFEDAEKLAVVLRSNADKDPNRADYLHKIADRILAGYNQKAVPA